MVVRRVLRWFFRLALGLAFLALALILVASYAPDVIRKATADLGKVANIGSKMLAPPLLAERLIIKCAWLKQNWSDEDRAWVHNASQGTATFPVPYAWFRHLERPEITLRGLFAGIDLVSDPAYLARLGFIAPNKDCDPPAPADAPDGYGVLPVRFAVLKGGVDPATGKTFEPALGLTCSACHTGQINYKGVQLQIDGAPAMIDLANLERVIGLSVCYAKLMPWRSGQLADAVLDELPDVTGEAREQKKEAIEKELEDICDKKVSGKVEAERTILTRRKLTHTEEGFGRLDALNRIGNQVFHENLADK